MLAKQISGAAAAVQPAYIEDVFSTYLYTGNASTQTITNGIDLSGKGGLVWIKARNGGNVNHRLFDTVRGATKSLVSNQAIGQGTQSDSLTAFGSTGFSLGADTVTGGNVNGSGVNFVSWAFREQAKFFDVVTYTGNGANRTISHNLGSVPGCIIVKTLDPNGGDWRVYHRGLANTEYLTLNSNPGKATDATMWNSTTATSTVFSIGTNASVNANGQVFVAYLFAHNAGGFGLTGTDNVISCGSFTHNAGSVSSINLGWEPQWLLIKESAGGSGWYLYDNMRGIVTGGDDTYLNANTSSAENGFGVLAGVDLTATGFNAASGWFGSSTYIYIAIRRGPMRTPTSGTSVFAPTTFSTASGSNQTISSPQAIDMGLLVHAPVNGVHYVATRLIGSSATLQTQSTAAESTTTTAVPTPASQNAFTSSMFFRIEGGNQTNWNSTGSGTNCFYGFRRAPGFFDVVCYTGDNSGPTRSIPHNLGVAPELIIHKYRNLAGVNWNVYLQSLGTNAGLILNGTNATITPRNLFNTPTASSFVVRHTSSDTSGMNWTGTTYVAYLFASCPGVSKVGSYTGTGATQTINCGFTGGARFVLIKRTDSTGDWYVWDSARGIVAGNDPYLLLNSTAAEVTSTDYIDTYSAGFEISSTAPAAINANGGTFIFLAIA